MWETQVFRGQEAWAAEEAPGEEQDQVGAGEGLLPNDKGFLIKDLKIKHLEKNIFLGRGYPGLQEVGGQEGFWRGAGKKNINFKVCLTYLAGIGFCFLYQITGESVREVLKIPKVPKGSISKFELEDEVPDFTVFVQSTSHNRWLITKSNLFGFFF